MLQCAWPWEFCSFTIIGTAFNARFLELPLNSPMCQEFGFRRKPLSFSFLIQFIILYSFYTIHRHRLAVMAPKGRHYERVAEFCYAASVTSASAFLASAF